MNHSRRKDSRNLSSKPLFLISIILAVLLFTVYEILAMCGFVPPIGDPTRSCSLSSAVDAAL